MVVEKRDEEIKGRFSIKPGKRHGGTKGHFEYEYRVANKAISPAPRQHFTVMGMPVQRESETREGKFVVLQDYRSISSLSYSVIYSSAPDFESSKAKLAIYEQHSGKDRLSNAVYHHFEDGFYTHSEVSPGSSFFEQVQLPSGLTLCRAPNDEDVEKARQDMYPIPQGTSSIETCTERAERLGEAERKYKKQKERAKPLSVIVRDFQIPEPIKEELQKAEYPLIKMLIGRYL